MNQPMRLGVNQVGIFLGKHRRSVGKPNLNQTARDGGRGAATKDSLPAERRRPAMSLQVSDPPETDSRTLTAQRVFAPCRSTQ